MKTQVTPDKQKARALTKMAEITLLRLKETETEKYPSNTLLDYYDIIHKLLEALTIRVGIKFRGEGAHQELIDFCMKKHKMSEQTRVFLQQLREYRNQISYEGFMIKESYMGVQEKRIEEIITRLQQLLRGNND